MGETLTRWLLRAIAGVLSLCAVFQMIPTGWLITPHKIWVIDVAGAPMLRFQRRMTLPWEIVLHWEQVWSSDDTGIGYCPAVGSSEYAPNETGIGLSNPWTPRCVPSADGLYTLVADRRACLLPFLCTRRQHWVNPEPIEVRDGQFVPSEYP